MIMTLAQINAAIAIISEIRVRGVDQVAFDNLRIELNNEPTRLIATKNTKFDIYKPHEV
jgi:hypothetical protein